MPRLSILIVTYNSRNDIDACLGSLSDHAPSASHETLVIDNASSDGTADAVRRRWPAVQVVDAGGNVGFARANNIGARRSTGDLVLLLNPDTIVTAGAIDALVATLDQEPGIAIAGPRLVDGHGHAELSFGAMLSPLAEFRQKVLVRGSDRGVPAIRAMVERLTRRARDVDWVSGACLLVRRSAADAAGWMDERYFMYAEDVDFCAAVRVRGGRVRFIPTATVMHLRGRSGAGSPERVAAAYRRSQVAFYEKHRPRWVPVLKAYLKLTGRWLV